MWLLLPAVVVFGIVTVLLSDATVDGESGHVERRPVHRLDVTCCGYGDRLKVIAKHIDSSHTLAINWGPCGDVTDNVWAYMFDNMPVYEDVDCKDGSVTTSLNLLGSSLGGPAYYKCRHPNVIPRGPRISDTQNHLIKQLGTEMYKGMSDHIRTEVESLTAPVAWHVRYGNPDQNGHNNDKDFARKRRGSVFGDDLDEYIMKTIAEINRIAGTETKVFVSTDTKRVLDRIIELGSGRFYGRNNTLYSKTGHFMTFPRLRTNNGGKACDIRWFEDPVKDMMTMGNAKILFSSNPSGFTLLPASRVMANGGLYCVGGKTDGQFKCSNQP